MTNRTTRRMQRQRKEQRMQEREHGLKFSQKQLDYIVNVLATRPYAEVAELLTNISQQLQMNQMLEQQAVTGPQQPAAKPNGTAQEAVQ